jgi:hypothetical protein
MDSLIDVSTDHTCDDGKFWLAVSQTTNTVKVSNFGPHRNFGPFLARFVASLGEFCAKKLKMNRLCKLKVYLQR